MEKTVETTVYDLVCLSLVLDTLVGPCHSHSARLKCT